MSVATEKKVTVATVKAFIRRNRKSLLINVKSRFDGMQDMVTSTGNDGFTPICAREYYSEEVHKYVPASEDCRNTMGICGVWFTGRDSVRRFEAESVTGFEVYNCCGTWRVAIAR